MFYVTPSTTRWHGQRKPSDSCVESTFRALWRNQCSSSVAHDSRQSDMAIGSQRRGYPSFALTVIGSDAFRSSMLQPTAKAFKQRASVNVHQGAVRGQCRCFTKNCNAIDRLPELFRRAIRCSDALSITVQ